MGRESSIAATPMRAVSAPLMTPSPNRRDTRDKSPPPATVSRAKAVLAKLEAGRAKTGGLAAGLDDLPLFAAAAQAEEDTCDAIRAEVEALDIDALTPREALDTLYRLKALAREG